MIEDRKIHIPAKRQGYVEKSQPVRMSEEAYNALVDICNKTGMLMSQAASLIILAAAELIVYDRE